MGKVIVGWLDDGEVEGKFAESLLNMVVVGHANGLVGGWLRLETGPSLDRARNDLTERFLTTDGEWFLTVDSDMIFPPTLLEDLLKLADPEERPIVGPACYTVGHDGPYPVIYAMDKGRFAFITTPPADTLLKVDGVGAACLLIHRTALERMAAVEVPGQWWDHLFYGDKPVGEDLSFCVRARLAGVPIFVHTGLPIRHIKQKVALDYDLFARWRREHRFVVTGTGRCGTGYVAALMRAMQVPCTHEGVYGPDGQGEWGDRRGDSSWMAAPFLAGFPGRVVHLVRNPLDVVNSLVGIGFFDPKVPHGAYREFARKHCPQAFETDDPILAAATFVICWNQMVAPFADLTVKVEEIDDKTAYNMLRTVGADPSLLFVQKHMADVPTNLNSRHRADLDWGDMPSQLADHAEELGYGIAAV